jgi:hypothetical protein
MGFLEPLPKDVRFRKEGRNWKIYFRRGRSAQPKAEEPTLSAHPLVKELVARGVTEMTACELIQQQSAERIEGKIDIFDWMAARHDKRIQKSPAGYLAESIRRDYATPKGFIPKAERERQEVMRKRSEQKEREDRAKTAREEAEAREEHQAILDHWNSLSTNEQDAVDAAAIAGADPKILSDFKGAPALERMYRTGIRHDYIRNLLWKKQTS